MNSTEHLPGGIAGGCLALLMAALGAAACAPESPDRGPIADPQPGVEAFLSGGILPSRDEEAMRRQSAMAGELARTIEQLGGVARARVHLHLADRSILSRDAQTPTQAAVLVVRDQKQGPDEARVRSLVVAAVPGLAPDRVRVFFSGPSRSDPSTVKVGPIEVAPSSARTARICFAALLSTCALLALGLIGAGIRMRRLKRQNK